MERPCAPFLAKMIVCDDDRITFTDLYKTVEYYYNRITCISYLPDTSQRGIASPSTRLCLILRCQLLSIIRQKKIFLSSSGVVKIESRSFTQESSVLLCFIFQRTPDPFTLFYFIHIQIILFYTKISCQRLNSF